ncbi:hypothetical protein K0T92_19440 [Paenibacillus oenotherae]|uniref:Uncharacterized protein n=2 Tax=Paenibacillus oenotherae TaxID=1435645 RepID=A0ABS7DAL1_9BACL|nr:hypothetical protein [Paenibacillus oenotherae]
MASISGCNYERRVKDSTFDYGTRQKNDPKMHGARMYGTITGHPGQHDNAWLEYSSLLSTEVSNINGVAAGLVMITDKNAYAAISLDWTGVGTKKSGGRSSREQDNSGSTKGVYNINNGSPHWNNERMVGPYNSNFTVNDHNQISEELKQTIAVQIRKLAPAVQEVHISANQTFVNEILQYAKEAWSNHSLTPWTESFNVLVKHQFAGGDELPVPLNILKQKQHASPAKRD